MNNKELATKDTLNECASILIRSMVMLPESDSTS